MLPPGLSEPVINNALTPELAALPEAESERLRETLDVGELPSVYALLEQLRQGLEQLAGILKECAAAARLDQGRTLRRAHEMGGG